ncbi:crooked neck-like protein 1 [Citrus sinensis]|uniref:Crooked neck-like protein 1 n=1 Tax=Citrus sinensis TaxID=2711 RepID=A0ACB8KKA6_CITSI|nr:crooked neck-like protein 1 [Citrus sinensis]
MLIASNYDTRRNYEWRKFLEDAYLLFPNRLDILLELAEKVTQRDSGHAREFFCRAILMVGTNHPDSTQTNPADEKKLLFEGIKHFPSFFKLWLMLGQLEERFARFEDVREIYQKVLHNCQNCIPLWISLANVVEKIDGFSHAQNVYSHAKEVNPCNPELWAVEIDRCLENGKKNKAGLLMARALQECLASGVLWATYVCMVSDDQLEFVYSKAFSMSNNDTNVIVVVAALMSKNKNIEVARDWFEWVVKTDPDNGEFGVYTNEMSH